MRSYSVCLDSGLRAGNGCTNTDSALAYSTDMKALGYCDKHESVSYCSTGNGVANEYCGLMGASTVSKSLVKLDKDEVKAIKDALKCGLSGGYPDETLVYYTDGDWHGYSGNLQPGVKAHCLTCTVHNAESYAASQVPEPPTEGEQPTEATE